MYMCVCEYIYICTLLLKSCLLFISSRMLEWRYVILHLLRLVFMSTSRHVSHSVTVSWYHVYTPLWDTMGWIVCLSGYPIVPVLLLISTSLHMSCHCVRVCACVCACMHLLSDVCGVTGIMNSGR